jgi:hypothetical protein
MGTWLAFHRIKQYRRLDRLRSSASGPKQLLRAPRRDQATGGGAASTAGEPLRPHSIPTLPSTSRLSLKVLPFLVAVPCQIPKASLRSPLTFEYPRASNRDLASPSVKPFVGLIDRDNGDGSAGDNRFCARAEPATKLNIQITTKDGTRISIPSHERIDQRRSFSH